MVDIVNNNSLTDAGNSFTQAADFTYLSTPNLIEGELGQTINNTLDNNDYFSFVAPITSSYTFELSDFTASSNLWLYDFVGATLDYSANLGTADETITFDLEAGREYLVRVELVDTRSVTDYQLLMTHEDMVSNNLPVTVESISDVTTPEGQTAVHQVVLSSTTTQDKTFAFDIEHISTNSSDLGDYSFSSGVVDNGDGTITIPEGVRNFTVLVDINNDSLTESAEEYSLSIGTKSAVGTIDTVSSVIQSISQESGSEGETLTHTVTLGNALTASETFSFSINYTTVSASDVGTVSFTNNVIDNGDGTITVPEGVSSFGIEVPLVVDSQSEANESYTINVNGVTAIGTINEVPSSDLIDSTNLERGGTDGLRFLGTDGIDTLMYLDDELDDVTIAEYTSGSEGEWQITFGTTDSKTGATLNQVDVLDESIERAQFTDMNVAFDLGLNDSAGMAVVMTELGLNGQQTADDLGLWIAMSDSLKSNLTTVTEEGLMMNAINMGRKFIEFYAGDISNEDLVSHLYFSLTGTSIDSGTQNLFVDLLDTGAYSQAGLFVAAAEVKYETAEYQDYIDSGYVAYESFDSKIG